MIGSVEVGYGASDFQDSVVGARGESLLLHGALEETFGVRAEFTVGADLASGHLGVGKHLVAGFVETMALPVTSGEDACPDFGGSFSGRTATQFFVLNGRHLYMDIDAVEERAGDFSHVALNHRRRAHALAGFVVEVAAGAGVHGGGEHKSSREAERHGGARDRDGVIFKGLAHNLENIAGELGKFIKKKQSVVGVGHFAGAGDDAATDETCVRDGVVRRAEGA